MNSNRVGFFSHQEIGKCPYSTGVVVKQTNSIFLATHDNLKCYVCDQLCCIFCTQCCIFRSVLYGNNSILICLIFAYASALNHIKVYY